MASISVAPHPVNESCSVDAERERRLLVRDIARRHERLAADEVRAVEVQRGHHWHWRLLWAERALSIAHTAVLDAEIALAELVADPPHLTETEVDYAVERGLLPDDELGGGW